MKVYGHKHNSICKEGVISGRERHEDVYIIVMKVYMYALDSIAIIF